MEMDVRDRGAVDGALGVGNEVIDFLCVVLDPVRDLKPVNNGGNVGQGTVLMGMAVLMSMFMGIRVLVLMAVVQVGFLGQLCFGKQLRRLFFPAVDEDPEMRAGNVVAFGGERIDRYAGDAGVVEVVQEFIFVFHQFPESGRKHVAGGAVAAVKIKSPHKDTLAF